MQAARASYVGLSAVYSTGNASVALSELENATKRAPWEPIYYVQLAELLQQLGRTEEAAEQAQLAIEKSFYNPGLTPQLAQIIAAAGDLDAAVEAVREAAGRDPLAPGVQSSAANLMTRVGAAKQAIGEADAARRLYDEALGLVADRAAAVVELARLAAEGGDDDEAIMLTRASVALETANDESEGESSEEEAECEACAICGRTYKHEHVRSLTTSGLISTLDSDED
jgi:tetratricopeptide (TPR) repeat protein